MNAEITRISYADDYSELVIRLYIGPMLKAEFLNMIASISDGDNLSLVISS